MCLYADLNIHPLSKYPILTFLQKRKCEIMFLLFLLSIFSSIFHIYLLKWKNAVTYFLSLVSGLEIHNKIQTTVCSLNEFLETAWSSALFELKDFFPPRLYWENMHVTLKVVKHCCCLPFKLWNSRSSFFLSSTCSNSCFWSSSKMRQK